MTTLLGTEFSFAISVVVFDATLIGEVRGCVRTIFSIFITFRSAVTIPGYYHVFLYRPRMKHYMYYVA